MTNRDEWCKATDALHTAAQVHREASRTPLMSEFDATAEELTETLLPADPRAAWCRIRQRSPRPEYGESMIDGQLDLNEIEACFAAVVEGV